jgi:hypothetical protein
MAGVDVLLFQTKDGGEIDPDILTPGLDVMAYLCLFGGNDDDDGSEGNPLTWWANLDETDPASMYRSETQNILRGLPASSANLRRLEDAARRDLGAFISAGIAREVDAEASIIGLNRVRIVCDIDGQTEEFIETWEASQP